MEHKKKHFRHILYFFYREGINAAESHRRILSVYGEVSLSERSCRNWFQKFSSGDFSVHNSHRSGRPMADIDDDIQALIESDRHITERELGEKLNVPNSTIHDHIQKLGLVKKLDIWVPHELKEIHLTQRISTCDLLFKRNQDESFLKRIVTGDEKWVVYNNTERKRSWSKHGEPSQPTSKPELHQKKVMLSIWWDYKGVVYYELLPRGRTINSEVYCQQLTKLNESLQRSRPELVNRKGVIFHHDNARPHTSLMTCQKLLDLGWNSCHTCLIAPTLHHQITICSTPCKIPLMVKPSQTTMMSKVTWISSLAPATRTSTREESSSYQRDGKRS